MLKPIYLYGQYYIEIAHPEMWYARQAIDEQVKCNKKSKTKTTRPPRSLYDYVRLTAWVKMAKLIQNKWNLAD